MELNGKVVGYTDESGVTLPPLHPRCRCAIIYREEKASPVGSGRAVAKPLTAKEIAEMKAAEEAARHLEMTGASASYFAGANVAFIADDATVSGVLEEMYHAKQDRTKMFGEITDDLVTLK